MTPNLFRAKFCPFFVIPTTLLLIGSTSCTSRTQGDSPGGSGDATLKQDFGERPEELENVRIVGDFANDVRNNWWNKRSDLALYKEFVPAPGVRLGGATGGGETEEEIAARAIRLAREAQDQLNGAQRLRTFHAKSQACLKGTLTVQTFNDPEGEDAELRFGVFSDPGRSYSIIGRFSNGNGQAQSDAAGDPRGFAIKVLNVDGSPVEPGLVDSLPTDGAGKMHQDFLGTNSPVFPTRNASTYLDFHEATLKGISGLAQFFLNIPKDGPRTADILRQWVDGDIGSLADITYGSGGAFQMGTRAGKYWFRPCPGNVKSKKPRNPTDEYLSDELEQRLQSRGEICMVLEAQIQRHPVLHPIEDPSILWKNIPNSVSIQELRDLQKDTTLGERRARSAQFFPVATIRMPREGNADFRSPESKAFCEGLFFNTWHSTADHRPLGNINRVRRHSYKASFTHRTGAR